MARWCTPRRFLVYSAYFVGAFSLLIGLLISKHVWDINTTVRIMEKSWDLRGHDYRNFSWIDKAVHAVFAGHEDVSKYNELFWAKYGELEMTENGPGSFNRSNLTRCKLGYSPEWADANAGYEKWGFVLYRTAYDEDDKTWAETVQHINYTIRTHLEIQATHDGSECDPDLVRDRAVLEIIEDQETLERASFETIRALWRKRVNAGLVDSSFKTGGWDWGWFRMRLSTGGQKPNGMALNLCLVYDSSTRLMMYLSAQGFPATGPRDPWEPFLLAVDGMWSPDRYQYLTSWAEGYQGAYGVALSILFNDFHGKTFEREMERQAPRMFNGGPLIDPTASWLQWLFQTLLVHAVARPGQFPFHKRWQEMHWPFVREDSHWKYPAKPESIQVDEDVKASEESSDPKLDLERLLEPSTLTHYLPCLDSDENQEDCFQIGNLRVRKGSPSKKPQFTEEVEPTNKLRQDAFVNQGPSLHLP